MYIVREQKDDVFFGGGVEMLTLSYEISLPFPYLSLEQEGDK